jgi:hypothetical protein
MAYEEVVAQEPAKHLPQVGDFETTYKSPIRVKADSIDAERYPSKLFPVFSEGAGKMVI